MMRIQKIFYWGVVLTLLTASCESKKETTTEEKSLTLSNQMDSISYAMGINLAEVFVGQAKLNNLNIEAVKNGFTDFENGKAYLNEQQAGELIGSSMMSIQAGGQITNPDSLSYALGVNIAGMFKNQDVKGVDPNYLAFGFKSFTDSSAMFKAKDASVYLMSFFEKNSEMKNKDVIEEGKRFLEENSKRPEITTLPSGLQYEIMKEGKGDKPVVTDVVSTHYHGTLVDGTVFDSSVDRGEPSQFGLNQVIPGWTEVLQLMPVGSKWRVYLPYNLAYGSRGSGEKIGPYSTLIFEIELLKIVNEK